MSKMKQAMIEDDGFITVDMQKASAPVSERNVLKAAHTALAEFGVFLGSNDCELSRSEMRRLIPIAIEILDAQPHPLECPRCYDDYDCTCHLGETSDQLFAALEDLMPVKCEPCNGTGTVNPSKTHGFGYDPQMDRDCPECKGEGTVESNLDGLTYTCAECAPSL